MNRLLAHRRIELHRLPDRFRRCLDAAHHFDKRNDVRRVERVADKDALGTLAARLHHAGRDARGARGDDRIGGRGFVHVGKQLDLELGPLGSVLLNEVGLRERLFHIRREAQAVARCTGREPDRFKLFPGFVNILAQVRFGIGAGIGCDDVEAAGEVLRRPACSDDSGAHDGDTVNWLVVRHDHVSLGVE